MYYMCSAYVFFFKQKTAYEMRISDWSSDVCSSDLTTMRVDRAMRACAPGRVRKSGVREIRLKSNGIKFSFASGAKAAAGRYQPGGCQYRVHPEDRKSVV